MVDWSHLPTLTQLEAVLRRTTPGRAYFDDLIPGEVLRKAAGALATVCFPEAYLDCNRTPIIQRRLVGGGLQR